MVQLELVNGVLMVVNSVHHLEYAGPANLDGTEERMLVLRAVRLANTSLRISSTIGNVDTARRVVLIALISRLVIHVLLGTFQLKASMLM